MTFCEAKEAGRKIISNFFEEREKRKREEENEKKNYEILQMIKGAKEDLFVAQNNFDFADEDKLLEYRIFNLKAAEARLSYFLKLAKDKDIKSQTFIKSDEKSRRSLV